MAISLNKGGRLSLSKEAPDLKKALIGLGWDPRATDGAAFDLDASAFLLGADGKVLVLDPDDRLQALAVDLIRRQGDEVLLRGAGLEGREVVIGRTPLLGAGIRVRPLREDASAEVPQEPDMVDLSEERRDRLVAFVEGNTRLPEDVKARVLGALASGRVPAQMVQRIESRMGG